MKNAYACSRCDGKGRIGGFSHVLGGVCFACKGSGRQKSRPTKSEKWAVFAKETATGVWTRIYNATAPSAKKAIERAATHYAKASAKWRADYTMDGAVAIRWKDLPTPDALTLDTRPTTQGAAA